MTIGRQTGAEAARETAETTCAFISPFTRATKKTTLNFSPVGEVRVFVTNCDRRLGVNIFMFVLYQKHTEVKIFFTLKLFTSYYVILIMDTLIHADIFFFITSIAIVICGVFIVIIAVYAIKILADIKEITSLVKKESLEIVDDVHRELVEGSSATKSLFKTIGRIIKYIRIIYNKI